jgi:hypothetical protein
MRKPRNAEEGFWDGFAAVLACLTLAAIIIYRMTTRPNSLLWDITGLIFLFVGSTAEFVGKDMEKTAA